MASRIFGMVFGYCCRLRVTPEKGKTGILPEPGDDSPSAAAQIVPAVPLEMLRCKSENRILKPSTSREFKEKDSHIPCSARSLFEASMRRVELSSRSLSANAVGKPDIEDNGIPLRFLEAYITAIKKGNTHFASEPLISEMFGENAKLIAQDKSTHYGKAAVLRRLDRGMEQIVKMAGKDAAIPTYELTGPTRNDEGGHVVTCLLRRGVSKISFSLEFVIMDGKITLMRNTRL